MFLVLLTKRLGAAVILAIPCGDLDVLAAFDLAVPMPGQLPRDASEAACAAMGDHTISQ